MPREQIPNPPFAGLHDRVRGHAIQRPAHLALVQDTAAGVRRLDYATLDVMVDRIAAALQRDRVGLRDVVAVCAGNSVEYVALFIGVLRAGGCVAPLPWSATPETVALMRADSGAALAFADRDLESLESWMAEPGVRPRPVEIQPNWPFNIIYSSGTTGTPKGIVQPHAMRWTHMHRAARLGYGPDAVTLVSTPLYSNTTLVSLLPTLGLGGTAILMPKFDVHGYLELARKYVRARALREHRPGSALRSLVNPPRRYRRTVVRVRSAHRIRQLQAARCRMRLRRRAWLNPVDGPALRTIRTMPE